MELIESCLLGTDVVLNFVNQGVEVVDGSSQGVVLTSGTNREGWYEFSLVSGSNHGVGISGYVSFHRESRREEGGGTGAQQRFQTSSKDQDHDVSPRRMRTSPQVSRYKVQGF